MAQPIDQSSILRGGMSLVPDYATQELNRRQVAMQEQQGMLQAQRQQQALMQAQREQQQAEAFQAAMDDYLVDPDSASANRKMAGMLGRFPQFRESIEGAWKGLDAAKQNSDMRALGNIYAAGEAGRFDVAANELQARIDAEVAAGQPADPIDQAMVQALKSGDPVQQRAAIRQAGLLLEVASGGKLSTTAKPTADEQNYEWRVRTFGRDYANRAQATQDEKVVGVPGVGVFRGSDLVEPAPGMPGLVSGYGGGTFNLDGTQATPVQQGMEGGDPASQFGGVPAPELGGNGLPDVIDQDQYRVLVANKGQAATDSMIARNGIRVVGRGNPIPVPIKSKQQYEKLPSGTQYIAPDGSLRRKP